MRELREEIGIEITRMVQKFMQHSCKTLIPAEALAAAYSASGLLLANLFRREEEDVAFPLVVSSRVKMIDEFG